MNYSQLKKELTKIKNDSKLSRKEMIRQLSQVPELGMEDRAGFLCGTHRYTKMPLAQLREEYLKALRKYPEITEPTKPVTLDFIMRLLKDRSLPPE